MSERRPDFTPAFEMLAVKLWDLLLENPVFYHCATCQAIDSILFNECLDFLNDTGVEVKGHNNGSSRVGGV